jgi:hypothetical protein
VNPFRSNPAEVPAAAPIRRQRLVLVSVLAFLLASATACGTSSAHNDAASGADDPAHPPHLFPPRVLTVPSHEIEAQTATAHRLMRGWWGSHDNNRHDGAFARWLEHEVPSPPSPRQRTTEIRQLATLAATRTSTGVAAATWLDDYGKDDIWKQYARQQASQGGNAASGHEMDDMLDLGSQVTDTLKNHFQVPSPYVVDTSLRPDKAQATRSQALGDPCTCSYPSTHAAASAAAVTYLSHFAPRRADLYRHMQEEIDYSRLYMAGHVNSDLAAGTLLGDMLGEYFVVSHHNGND